MFNVKASVVKSLTVVGKLLILLNFNQAVAGDISNPRFFEYRSGSFVNELATVTFGWFKTLNEDQQEAYNQSIVHSLMYAENGEKVEWFRGNASGFSMPVMTWPTGSGYCRRIHIQAIAYNTEKTMAATACFDNAHTNWRWVAQ